MWKKRRMKPPPIELSAKQIFDWDQSYAENVDLLAQLIEAHLYWQKEDRADGIPKPISISLLAEFLSTNWSRELLASVLTAAVELMSKYASEEEGQG